MSATSVDTAGLAFIAREEGGQSPDGLYRAYWDQYGHVWTIGIGETSGVRAGMVWTAEEAYQDLEHRLASEYVPAILATGYPFNQNELNGFASAVWNLGPGLMNWDVGRYLRAKNIAAAADALLAYDRAGGVVLAGLAARRQRERALILTPVAPPPDSHRYSWYPNEAFEFKLKQSGRIVKVNEQKTVQAYDRLFASDRSKAILLRPSIKMLRDRVYDVAYIPKTGAPHWEDSRHLGWRWQRLNDRLKGPVKL